MTEMETLNERLNRIAQHLSDIRTGRLTTRLVYERNGDHWSVRWVEERQNGNTGGAAYLFGNRVLKHRNIRKAGGAG